jgi:hypothetical protein
MHGAGGLTQPLRDPDEEPIPICPGLPVSGEAP